MATGILVIGLLLALHTSHNTVDASSVLDADAALEGQVRARVRAFVSDKFEEYRRSKLTHRLIPVLLPITAHPHNYFTLKMT